MNLIDFVSVKRIKKITHIQGKLQSYYTSDKSLYWPWCNNKTVCKNYTSAQNNSQVTLENIILYDKRVIAFT